MTLPPEIMEGFIAEAATYLHEIHALLAEAADQGLDEGTITALHDKLDVVSGSAALLEMDEVVTLTTPVVTHLAAYPANGEQPEELLGDVRDVVQEVATLLGVTMPSTPPPPAEQAAPAAPSALANLPPELIAIFQREAEEHQHAIQQGVSHLAQQPSDDATMRDVRRAAHTLKGASASVGFKPLAEVTHILEDLLDASIDGQQPLDDDTLKLMADIAYAVEELVVPTGAEIDALLAAIRERAAAQAEQTPTTPRDVAPTPASEPTPQRSEAAVRLPISTIDNLIDALGEVIINHGAFGEHMRALRALLADFGTSSQRLQRLAEALDAQIERESLNLVTQMMRDHDADSEFDSIELDRYSAFYQLARELEETAADARDINTQLDVLAQELNASLTRERRLASTIQEGLVGTKLMTFSEIVPRLERLVQHTAADLDLNVTFVVTGEDTRVDKTILDALLEPLTHLIRNAIGHGLEDPTTRIDAGKPAHGTIKLAVARDRGRITITLSDDGRGLNLEAIRQRAENFGLIAEGDALSENEIINLIFVDGFSTAQTVTQTSGRGVGMNIVRRSVHALQGTARVNTSSGRGTTFTLSIPVSLAIIRALFFTCRGIGYAAPLEQVSSVLRLDESILSTVSDDGVLTIDGERFKVRDLGSFTDPERLYSTDAGGLQRRYGLVIDLGDHRAAILIDGLAGIRDTVVKSLGNHLRRVHGVSGATISGDGQVNLILDLIEVASGQAVERDTITTGTPRSPAQPASDRLHVLVVDDSPSVRRVVGSFLESVGWQVTLARDGVDAMEKLSVHRPDVALVDIEMPRMNGYELLETVKADQALAGLPVVFLTSRSASKHRTRAEALGVDGYLVKPYHEEELIQTLRAVVRRVHA